MRFIGMEIPRDFCESRSARTAKVRSPGRIQTPVEQLELFPTATASRSVLADEPASGALRQPARSVLGPLPFVRTSTSGSPANMVRAMTSQRRAATFRTEREGGRATQTETCS